MSIDITLELIGQYYGEGEAAARNREPAFCPYPDRSPARMHWMRGYNTYVANNRKTLGLSGKIKRPHPMIRSIRWEAA